MSEHEAHDWQPLAVAMEAAVADTYRQGSPEPGATAMLSGFVLVSEWVAADGDRIVHVLANNDARTWQVLGWLEYLRADGWSQVTRTCGHED